MLVETRARRPAAVAEAAAARRRPPAPLDDDGRAMIIAADHTARGILGAGRRTGAMADRGELLDRIQLALSRPGVTGVMASPDILEDLLLLGVLDGKSVFGSMNRGGLQGATWEIDDRFTAYDADTIAANGLDGGKMLTRIALDEPGTAPTLEASGSAVTALARHGRMAMVEPFMTVRTSPNRVENLLDPDSVIDSIHIAAGLGATSARTWLKLPVVHEMARVLDATTLPCLLLGGDPKGEPADTYAEWGRALEHSSAAGLVVGRALLFPPDGDVASAVDAAVDLVHGGIR